MPSILDILGFVFSVVSLLAALNKLKAIVRDRLPQGRLQVIRAELAEMRDLFERLERVGDPDRDDAVRGLRDRLEELDARAAHLWLDVDRWKTQRCLRRQLLSAERVELSRHCNTLHRDAQSLRARLHQLTPRLSPDRSTSLRATAISEASSTVPADAIPLTPTDSATSSPSTVTTSSMAGFSCFKDVPPDGSSYLLPDFVEPPAPKDVLRTPLPPGWRSLDFAPLWLMWLQRSRDGQVILSAVEELTKDGSISLRLRRAGALPVQDNRESVDSEVPLPGQGGPGGELGHFQRAILAHLLRRPLEELEHGLPEEIHFQADSSARAPKLPRELRKRRRWSPA